MNCALEDCRILSEAIEAGNDWHGIFDTFECGRKPDTEAISLLSRNNYVEMRRSVVEPHYLEKREIVRILTQRYPEQFVPLYSMVAFTSIPYSLALRRHTIQDEIVETLCNPGYPIDFNLADRLVSERLSGLRAGCGLVSDGGFRVIRLVGESANKSIGNVRINPVLGNNRLMIYADFRQNRRPMKTLAGYKYLLAR